MAGGRTELEEQLAQSELDLEKQERVLGVLEQWRQDLIDYGETQAGLLDEREKELSRYTFAELPPFESKVRTRLPGTFTALGKLKGKELDEARDRIDDVIADRRREQEAKPTSRADRMLTVESLDDFDDMTDEVETLREELSAYFKNAGTREQKDWYKNHPWNAISDNDRAELSEHSSYYEGTRQTYQTAKKAYEDAEAQTDPEKEFEFYKSLVARKIILKQVVKDVGFHGISKARNFTQFQKLSDSEKAQVMDQVRTNLMLAGGADEMRLRGLGYTTPEFMQEALDDYLKIVGQVEQYGERIAARNIPEQTDWIKKYSRTESSHYLDKNGNPKKGFEELTALSAGYEPYKDVIGEKERLRGEMESARIPYYQALLSRRLLQKEAIKSAVKAENKRIEAENALDEERRKDHERWKDQAACDDRFRENTSDEITLSRAKSIDLMAGTMITGFAGRMTEAFGDTVSRVGAVLAEGIVKGETRQLEKELADLEADLKRARRAVGAGAANAAEDLSSVKDEVRETGTVSEEAAKAVKSSGAHMQQVTDGAERVQELEKQISEKRAALDQARKNEDERLAAIEKQFRGEQSDQVKRDQARIDLEAIGNRIIAEHTADYVTSAQGTKSGSSQSQSSGSTAAGSSQSQSSGSTAAGSSQGVLSDEMLKALMAARTNLRQRDLMTQEADAIRKDRDLQSELVELQGYSDKLKDLMKPENLEKVDTAVSVASTFFEVYQKVSGFVRGKAEAGEDDDASGKDSDTGDDAAEEKEQEEAFQLDIRETLEALNQKAEKIKASMEEDQPDRTTLAHEVTDLTMECGALIRVLSGKINDYSTRLESELEETEARAEADRSFLDEAAKTPEMSVVELAKEELKSQRELAAKEQSADLAIRDAAIETQRKAVEEARKKRDELAAQVEKERAAAATEGPVAQETGSGMTSTAASGPATGTPVAPSSGTASTTSASSPASAAPGQTTTGAPAAPAPEDDPLLAEKTLVARAGQQVALATENLKRKRAVLTQARRDVDARHRELVIIEDANLESRDEMTAWDDDPGEQYEKNAAFLKHQKDIADEDASRARKDGIKSAVYGIANDAAKGAKSF
nr:hypothetical protein [Lachnospiraceae bacterium]